MFLALLVTLFSAGYLFIDVAKLPTSGNEISDSREHLAEQFHTLCDIGAGWSCNLLMKACYDEYGIRCHGLSPSTLVDAAMQACDNMYRFSCETLLTASSTYFQFADGADEVLLAYCSKRFDQSCLRYMWEKHDNGVPGATKTALDYYEIACERQEQFDLYDSCEFAGNASRHRGDSERARSFYKRCCARNNDSCCTKLDKLEKAG